MQSSSTKMAAFNHPSSEQATEVHLTYMICCSPAYDVRNNFVKIKFLRQITDISFVFHVFWPPKYIGISMVLSFCKFLPIRSNHRFTDILSARQNVSDAVIWSYWWYQLCSGHRPPLWSCPQLGCPHWGSPVGTCVEVPPPLDHCRHKGLCLGTLWPSPWISQLIEAKWHLYASVN